MEIKLLSDITEKEAESAIHINSNLLNKDEEIILAVDKHNKFYVGKRGDFEYNFNYRQIIPYVVITSERFVLAYERLSGSGESRLVNSLSIGFGGHTQFIGKEFSVEETINESILRELEEEIGLKGIKPKYLFDIRENTNDVDKVHLGLVYHVSITDEQLLSLQSQEKDSINLIIYNKKDLTDIYNNAENWSKLVVNYLNKQLDRTNIDKTNQL